MRSYKRIMPLFLTVALIGSAAFAIHSRSETQASYESELAQARYYADMGIVGDAVTHYQSALGIEPSLDVYLEAGAVYMENGDHSGAQKWYERVLKAAYPREADTYLFGIQAYIAAEDYRDAYAVYHEYRNRELYSDAIEEEMRKYRYMYTISGRFQDAGVFSASTGLCAARYNGYWGYVNTNGARRIEYKYESAGLFGEYAPVVDRDGNAMYIDQSGAERINGQLLMDKNPDFGAVTEFQPIQSGLILACSGESWAYFDAETYEKRFGDYADALPVVNGTGAVSRDGKTWALIGPDGAELTDYLFTEVLADGKGIACRDGVLLACVGDSFLLIHADGTPVSQTRYEDAKAFNEASGLAAVKKDGRWIFIDTTGKEFDLGDFEDAESFSAGLAAVKSGGLWGYINTDGELAIDYAFQSTRPFSAEGVAFVETSEGAWQLLMLYQKKYA